MNKNPCATSDDYWDCECETNYIRPMTQKVCPKCGAEEEDCPASRVDELYLLNNIGVK